jgi:hypothetical protein
MKPIDPARARATRTYIEALTKDLILLDDQLSKEPHGASGVLSDDEVAIQELAERSRRMSKRLMEMLAGLKATNVGIFRKGSVIQKTVKASWKKEEVETMQRRLQELQSQINSRLLILIRYALGRKTSQTPYHQLMLARNEQCSIFVELKKLSLATTSTSGEATRELRASKDELFDAVDEKTQGLKTALRNVWSQTESMHNEALREYSQSLNILSDRVTQLAHLADNVDRT